MKYFYKITNYSSSNLPELSSRLLEENEASKTDPGLRWLSLQEVPNNLSCFAPH